MRKRFCTDSTSGPSTHRDKALSLGHVEHTKGSGAPNDNFRKNISSEDDLRSRIFGTFGCKISCLPASPRIFGHPKNGVIAYF